MARSISLRVAASTICRRVLATSAIILVAACGDGVDNGNSISLLDPPALGSALCASLDNQKTWVHSYMDGAYYWYHNMPAADPAAYSTVSDYFLALRWTPTDHYSFTMDEQSFIQLFQQGQEIGHGIDWKNDASAGGAIRVAYVEAGSPADTAGVGRGDTLVTVNGSAPTTSAVVDLLYPTATGIAITLELQAPGAASTRTVMLTSAVIDRHAVFDVRTLTASNGTIVGYLALNQFLAPDATVPALHAAFTNLAQAGVQDLVLDLRYNGGGYIAMADELAAMIAGTRVHANDVFASFVYNDKNTDSNVSFLFNDMTGTTVLSLPRVFVLTSGATASASELVINSLEPYVNVIQVGATTYGKPVGQVPVANCGQVYAPIVFESFNALGQGGYYSGIAPTCTATDDFDHALGDPAETMLGGALTWVTTGACPAVAAAAARAQVKSLAVPGAASLPDHGVRRAMLR